VRRPREIVTLPDPVASWRASTWGKLMKTKAQWIVVALLLAPAAHAYRFEPTEAEFLAWPDYCRVAYTPSNIGSRSRFASMVTQADVNSASRVLGATNFGGVGVHHYCAGAALLSRAQTEPDPEASRRLLERAAAETDFTFSKTEPSHHFFAQAATQMAFIHYELGHNAQAIKLLDEVIEAHPESAMAYNAKAVILFRRGEYETAEGVLVEGNEQVNGQSSEIHYNLGLVLIATGDTKRAAQHARQAYALGYPLPGLKQKLQRMGAWDGNL